MSILSLQDPDEGSKTDSADGQEEQSKSDSMHTVWSQLVSVLGVTPDQQEKFRKYRSVSFTACVQMRSSYATFEQIAGSAVSWGIAHCYRCPT